MRNLSLEDVMQYINELDEQYMREEKQAIMQRSMDKAVYALAGREACERVQSWLELRYGMARNVEVMTTRKARG